MPKEWGSTVPNKHEFQKLIPPDAETFLTNLQALADKWDYVTKCGVVKLHNGIFVDLNDTANSCKKAFGVPIGGCTADFYNPLKASEVDKADALVKAIVAKAEAKIPIALQDATALFATIEAPDSSTTK
jgi:hypothetical protein